MSWKTVHSATKARRHFGINKKNVWFNVVMQSPIALRNSPSTKQKQTNKRIFGSSTWHSVCYQFSLCNFVISYPIRNDWQRMTKLREEHSLTRRKNLTDEISIFFFEVRFQTNKQNSDSLHFQPAWPESPHFKQMNSLGGNHSETTHIIQINQIRPLQRIIKDGIILGHKSFSNVLVLWIECHVERTARS